MGYAEVVMQQEKERLAKLAEVEPKQTQETPNEETKPKRKYTKRNPSENQE